MPASAALIGQISYGPGTVEARLLLTSGQAQIFTRQSAGGGYLVTLDAAGSAALYRSGQLVTTGQSAPSPDGWWNLAFTAAGNDLRLTVNGLTVLAALDVSPLPPGTITLLATEGLLLEWLAVVESMAAVAAEGLMVAEPEAEAISEPTSAPKVPTAVSAFALQAQSTCPPVPPAIQAPGGLDSDLLVLAGDEANLILAIQTVNACPGQLFRLYIQPVLNAQGQVEIDNVANHFELPTVDNYGLRIQGQVIIYANNTTIRSSSGSSGRYSIIIVEGPGANVTFDHLILQNGRAIDIPDNQLPPGQFDTDGYGGGLAVGGGTQVSIFDSNIRYNYAQNGGGGIIAQGNLVIQRSRLENNSSSGGGALQITYDGVAAVECSSFVANSALFGGAIVGSNLRTGGSSVVVTRSHLALNNATIQDDIYNAAAVPQINATYNYWVDLQGTTPEVSSNVLTDPLLTYNPTEPIPDTDQYVDPQCRPVELAFVAGAAMNIETASLPAPLVSSAIIQSLNSQFQPQPNGDYPDVVTVNQIPGLLCDSRGVAISRTACSSYAYMAFYQLYESITGQPPRIWDLLALVYNLELSNFSSPAATSSLVFGTGWSLDPGELPQDIAFEALARNFFDGQAGACRYNAETNNYDCNYQNVVNWLGTIQAIYSRAIPINNNSQVSIRIVAMLGFPTSSTDFEGLFVAAAKGNPNFRILIPPVGMFMYETDVRDSIGDQLMTWRSGQGGDRPSAWGNQVLTNGETTYVPPPPVSLGEMPMHVIIHRHYSGGRNSYTFGTNTEPLTDIDCTYAAFVTTSDGRVPTQACPSQE